MMDGGWGCGWGMGMGDEGRKREGMRCKARGREAL